MIVKSLGDMLWGIREIFTLRHGVWTNFNFQRTIIYLEKELRHSRRVISSRWYVDTSKCRRTWGQWLLQGRTWINRLCPHIRIWHWSSQITQTTYSDKLDHIEGHLAWKVHDMLIVWAWSGHAIVLISPKADAHVSSQISKTQVPSWVHLTVLVRRTRMLSWHRVWFRA